MNCNVFETELKKIMQCHSSKGLNMPDEVRLASKKIVRLQKVTELRTVCEKHFKIVF